MWSLIKEISSAISLQIVWASKYFNDWKECYVPPGKLILIYIWVNSCAHGGKKVYQQLLIDAGYQMIQSNDFYKFTLHNWIAPSFICFMLGNKSSVTMYKIYIRIIL